MLAVGCVVVLAVAALLARRPWARRARRAADVKGATVEEKQGLMATAADGDADGDGSLEEAP